MKETPVIIIGAGPAGLSAALYLKRAGVSVTVLEKSAPGGKLLNLAEVSNYPGFSTIGGFELAQAFVQGAESQGVVTTPDEVVSVSFQDGRFLVAGREENYRAAAVVVASGLANVPSIKGEKEHLLRGVSYCATCDGPLFRKKAVALYGAGEKAIEEGLYLAALVSRLYFITPEKERGDTPLAQALFTKSNVSFLPESKVMEILGEGHVESLRVQTPQGEQNLPVAALFPLLGEKSASGFLSPLALRMENGFIPVDSSMMSSFPGLFAAGDIVKKPLRQVVTAASDGALASLGVLNYLRQQGVK
jgi:thioredoxin reductase (NADPH)